MHKTWPRYFESSWPFTICFEWWLVGTKRELHLVSLLYIFNHQPKLVNDSQGDGSTRFAPPWRRKSVHLYTFPSFRSSGRQNCDIFLICEVLSTRSHTLTYDNIPWKDSLASKPPPTESWSCPSVRVPPFVIVWPLWKLVPSCLTKPSLKNFHDPEVFSQERQMWCHTPSLAVTVVSLWWNKNDTTNHWAARFCFFKNKFLSLWMNSVFLYWNSRIDYASNELILREDLVCKINFAFLELMICAFLLENSEK